MDKIKNDATMYRTDDDAAAAAANTAMTTAGALPVSSAHQKEHGVINQILTPTIQDEADTNAFVASRPGHRTSNSASFFPAINDRPTIAAGTTGELARKEALHRDQTAAASVAADALYASHNQADIAQATYTYRKHRIGSSSDLTSNMDPNGAFVRMPHVPGEFPTDDGEDVHGVQEEHPISTTTATTETLPPTTTAKQVDHTLRNTAIGAGAGAGLGAAGLGAAVYETTKSQPTPIVPLTQPAPVVPVSRTTPPSVPATTAVLPDRTLSSSPNERETHPSGFGSTVIGAGTITRPTTIDATTTRVSNIERSVVIPEAQPAGALTTNPEHDYGRDSALAGGAAVGAGLGATALGTPSSAEQPTTQVSNIERSVVVPRAQPAGATATSAAGTSKPQHDSGRDSAFAGGAVGAAGYEASKNDEEWPLKSNTAAAREADPVDRHHYPEHTGSTGAATARTADADKSTAPEQHHYGRDAAVVGGAGAVGAGAAYAATRDGPHQTELANRLDPQVNQQPPLVQSQSQATQSPQPATQPPSVQPISVQQKHQQQSAAHAKPPKEASPPTTTTSKEPSPAPVYHDPRDSSSKLQKQSLDSTPPRSSYDHNTPSTPPRSSTEHHHNKLHKKSDPRGPTTPEILRGKRERGVSLSQSQHSGRGTESVELERSSQQHQLSQSQSLSAETNEEKESEGQWFGQQQNSHAGAGEGHGGVDARRSVERDGREGREEEWEEVENEGGEKIKRKKVGLLKRMFQPGVARGEEEGAK